MLGAGTVVHHTLRWFWIAITIAMAFWIERVLLHFYVNNNNNKQNEKSTTRKHIETYAKWNRFSTVCSFVSTYEVIFIKLNASTKLVMPQMPENESMFWLCYIFVFVLLFFHFLFDFGQNDEIKKLRHWLLTTAMEQFNEFSIDWTNIKVMIFC